MWWYNILEYKEGRISHILQLGPSTEGYMLLAANLVALKGGNCETILIVKITEWRKFIDYFSLSIKADPSKVDKNNINIVRIRYISITSSGNTHI